VQLRRFAVGDIIAVRGQPGAAADRGAGPLAEFTILGIVDAQDDAGLDSVELWEFSGGYIGPVRLDPGVKGVAVVGHVEIEGDSEAIIQTREGESRVTMPLLAVLTDRSRLRLSFAVWLIESGVVHMSDMEDLDLLLFFIESRDADDNEALPPVMGDGGV